VRITPGFDAETLCIWRKRRSTGFCLELGVGSKPSLGLASQREIIFSGESLRKSAQGLSGFSGSGTDMRMR